MRLQARNTRAEGYFHAGNLSGSNPRPTSSIAFLPLCLPATLPLLPPREGYGRRTKRYFFGEIRIYVLPYSRLVRGILETLCRWTADGSRRRCLVFDAQRKQRILYPRIFKPRILRPGLSSISIPLKFQNGTFFPFLFFLSLSSASNHDCYEYDKDRNEI